MFRAAVAAIVSLSTFAAVGDADARPPSPEGVLDHFLCYQITETQFGPRTVLLHDQFSEHPLSRTLTSRWLLCNPVAKQERGKGEPVPIQHNDTHLLCYMIDDKVRLRIKNQLDKKNEQLFKLMEERLLCVPTSKMLIRDPEHPPKTPMPPVPTDTDHFKCYTLTKTQALPGTYNLKDQIESYKVSDLTARYLCNPVSKTVDGEETRRNHAAAHLVCYIMKPDKKQKAVVRIKNQLDPEALLHISGPELLCVPSTKEWQ